MSQHLAVLRGPQQEEIRVVCDSEDEARRLEARWEARTLKTAQRRAVENIDDDDQEVCSTCGRPKLTLDEEEDER